MLLLSTIALIACVAFVLCLSKVGAENVRAGHPTTTTPCSLHINRAPCWFRAFTWIFLSIIIGIDAIFHRTKAQSN
jgi:hypothetical protein